MRTRVVCDLWGWSVSVCSVACVQASRSCRLCLRPFFRRPNRQKEGYPICTRGAPVRLSQETSFKLGSRIPHRIDRGIPAVPDHAYLSKTWWKSRVDFKLGSRIILDFPKREGERNTFKQVLLGSRVSRAGLLCEVGSRHPPAQGSGRTPPTPAPTAAAHTHPRCTTPREDGGEQ